MQTSAGVFQQLSAGSLDFGSGGSFRQDAFERDVLVINALYYDRGYLTVQIATPRVMLTPDRTGIELINLLFGGRFTSMLNEALRVNSGLTYGARSAFEQHKALAGAAPAAARWFSLEEEDAPSVHRYLSQDSIEERNPFEIVTHPPASARASSSMSSMRRPACSVCERTVARASRYSASARSGRSSVTSATVRMTDTGVRSSCEASAMNCRCAWSATPPTETWSPGQRT